MLSKINPDTRHQHWTPISLALAAIPASYRPWIELPGSLTQALKARTEQFSVEVLEQTRVVVCLPIPGFENKTEHCFSRKVLLKNGETPWVAAHTLIPESSLINGLEALTKLENKPLGELLFSTPGVTKDHQQVCQTANGWGRRARYLLKQQPLLVSEFFLPALITHEHKRTEPLY